MSPPPPTRDGGIKISPLVDTLRLLQESWILGRDPPPPPHRTRGVKWLTRPVRTPHQSPLLRSTRVLLAPASPQRIPTTPPIKPFLLRPFVSGLNYPVGAGAGWGGGGAVFNLDPRPPSFSLQMGPEPCCYWRRFVQLRGKENLKRCRFDEEQDNILE